MVDVLTGPRSGLRLDAGRWWLDDRVDAASIDAFRSWAADDLLSESLNRVPEDVSENEALDIVRRHDGRTAWLLFIREFGVQAPVGYVSMSADPANGVATVEFVIGNPLSRGMAVMDRIALALGEWAFIRQRMRKAFFSIRSDNRVTARWLERNAVLEGRLRGDIVLPDGRVVDRLLYGMMPAEWEILRDRVSVAVEETGDVPRRQHAAHARIGLRRR